MTEYGADYGRPGPPDMRELLYYRPELMDTREACLLCLTTRDVDAVELNAVCLRPERDALAKAQPFFEAFPRVLLVHPSIEFRAGLVEDAWAALPAVELWETAQSAYEGCASLQALRDARGMELAPLLWRGARKLPPNGLLDATEIVPRSLPDAPRISSGIPGLDLRIGGLFDGEVSVWTGRQGAGKTVLLGLPVLSALREGRSVCVYSGELSGDTYMEWLLAQAAGPQHLQAVSMPPGRLTYVPEPEVAAQIQAWWHGRLMLYDNCLPEAHDPVKLLDRLRYAIRSCGASVLVVDNLMTLSLSGDELYRAQSRFVGSLVDLTHRTGVQVHLVAHQRKGGTANAAVSDDVAGSADIINRADNAFSIARGKEGGGVLTILKNRNFGVLEQLPLRFHQASRRFYDQSPDWLCGWEE